MTFPKDLCTSTNLSEDVCELQALICTNDAVDKVLAGHQNVKARLHIGGAYYLSVTSGFRCVDFRKFYRPYDANSNDEIRPNRKGVALHLQEWTEMCALIDKINRDYPPLADAQTCYYGDYHLNQIGWLEYRECNLLLDHPVDSST